jgi:hypothetical protein
VAGVPVVHPFWIICGITVYAVTVYAVTVYAVTACTVTVYIAIT